ncbi:MAG: ABC transporter substrate-binding protein [Stutzerimonas stutzeri]|nr:MAG: ABC transporter substrate-binding protein [Stutzerimonas stutzeri]
MTIIDRRNLLKLSAAGAAALAAPAFIRTANARTRNLTVASLFADDKPETKIWVKISELVEAKLPGRFRFNIVKSGALGGEKEVAENIRLGSVQASLSTVSSLSGWVPELQILDLPFLFRDADHVRKVVTGETGTDLKTKLAAQQFIAADFINYGARHLLTVIQSPLHTKLWSAFGTTPVGIPITETYNALATGVADAMDLTKSAYAGFKLYEVVPYLTETGHIWASGVVYYGATFWNQLDDEEKKVLLEASSEGAQYFNQLIVEDEVKSVELALSKGGKVLQPEALDEWRKGAQGVWQDFSGIVGGIEKIQAVQSA